MSDGVLVKREGGRGWHRINASDFVKGKHEIYTPPAPPPPPPAAPLAPPPGPPDVLAGLANNWRQSVEPAELKRIAAALTGRTVEDVKQAIDVIAAEFEARKAK
jgi:hypothetical protein